MTFKKLVVLIVAAVTIAVFIIGFFGIASKYGDITTVYLNGVQNIIYDADFVNTGQIVLSPPAATEDSPAVQPTAEELDQIKAVIERRLEMFRLSDYSVQCDYENGKILLDLPLNSNIASDFTWILSTICGTGEITAYAGNADSVEGREVLFSTDDIVKINFDVEQDTFAYYYVFEMILDRDAKAALKEATTALSEEYASTEEIQYIMLWYNGAKIGTVRISDVIKNGRITYRSSTIEQTTMNELLVYLNTGTLPYTMSYDTIYSTAPAYGADPLRNVGLALACGFAAVFVYLIIRFRLIGLTGAIATLGTMGFSLFFLTGFMTGRGINGTSAALAAFILIALLCVETAIRNGNAVHNALAKTTVIKGVPEGLKATLPNSLILYAVVLLVGILLVLCGFNNAMVGLLSLLGLGVSGITALGTFGAVLIAGIVSAALFNILLDRVMIRSLVQSIKKPALYGGGDHE